MAKRARGRSPAGVSGTQLPPGDRAPAHPILGWIDLALAAAMLAGIWLALPARWWPVDVFGSALAALLAVSGAALLRRLPWAPWLGAVAAFLLLVPGLALVTALAVTAGNLAGLYGPVGMGASIILTVAFLLFVPYFIVFPAAQLFFLARPTSTDAPR